MATQTQADAVLEDVEVLEVSAVDRAANKRKFILVKNASGNAAPAEPVPADNVPSVEPGAEGVQKTEVATPEPPVTTQETSQEPPKNDVEKRGAKMAKSRLDRLEKAIADLGTILSELKDEVDSESDTEGDTGTATKSKTTKSEDASALEARVEQIAKANSDLQATVDTQAKKIAEQDKVIAEQKSAIAKQAEIILSAKQSAKPNSELPNGDPTPGPDPQFRWKY